MESLLFGTAGVPASSPKPDSLAGIARLRELGPAGLEDMHIHLSGIEYGPRGEREHVMLDEADLALRRGAAGPEGLSREGPAHLREPRPGN